nr:MAG TPA: hypothetical protein [Bacteriophage sp.]
MTKHNIIDIIMLRSRCQKLRISIKTPSVTQPRAFLFIL